MWVQNGGFSKWVFLALIFNSVANCQNTNGNIGNIDLEKVRKAVIDPSTISNQITGTVLNEVFVNTGYIIGGSLYQLILSLNLPEETMRMIKRVDYFFAPTPLAKAAFRQIRIDTFQLLTRILFNAATDPFNTFEEFRDMTIQEHVDRALDQTWLFNNVIRSGYDTFMMTILLAIYAAIGEARRPRKKRDLNSSFNETLDSKNCEEDFNFGFDEVLANLVDTSDMFCTS